MNKQNFVHPSLRVLALVLDLFIMFVLCLGFLVLLTNLSDISNIIPSLILFISESIFAIFLYSFICIYMIASNGQTPGKFLAGIKVVKEDSTLLTLKEAFYREFIAKMLSNGFFFLGYFWAFYDTNRQTWHDQASGTYVIKSNSYGSFSGLVSLVLLLLLGGYFGFQSYTNIRESSGVIEELIEIVSTTSPSSSTTE